MQVCFVQVVNRQVLNRYGNSGDPGSRITIIGLAANVGLTVSKGAAGWYMNSASLLADAGHTAGGAFQPYSRPQD